LVQCFPDHAVVQGVLVFVVWRVVMFRFIGQSRAAQSFVAVLYLACFSLTAGGAWAQAAAGPDFQGVAQDWLRDATAAAQPVGAAALRLEVKVGNLDSRLKLAPCGNVEPYLPPGSRLWGRTRIGLRCIDGVSRWNVSLPVTVNAFGNAWVIKGAVAAGATLAEDDVVEAEVNWAEEASPVLRDRALWAGQIATRALTTGQTLRQGMVKPAQRRAPGFRFRLMRRPCQPEWLGKQRGFGWKMVGCPQGWYWTQEQ
jgi:flagella basal body P-ring formation protein FlgA